MRAQVDLSVPEKSRILRESSEALHRHLDAFSVCYVDREDGYRPARGTLVELGGRCFVVTCGHSIPAHPQHRLFFFGRKTRSETEEIRILNFGLQTCSSIDVGYFEFDPDEARSQFAANLLAIDRVAPYLHMTPKRFVGIPGSPSDPSYFVVDREKGLMCASSVMAITTPLDVDAVVVPPDSPRPDPYKELFLDWPKDPMRDTKTWVELSAPEPFGFSGTAVWDYGFDGTLWSPEKTRLVAIQSCWSKDGEYLRCTLIRHWLKLILRDYPDLVHFVKSTFPAWSD